MSSPRLGLQVSWGTRHPHATKGYDGPGLGSVYERVLNESMFGAPSVNHCGSLRIRSLLLGSTEPTAAPAATTLIRLTHQFD